MTSNLLFKLPCPLLLYKKLFWMKKCCKEVTDNTWIVGYHKKYVKYHKTGTCHVRIITFFHILDTNNSNKPAKK